MSADSLSPQIVSRLMKEIRALVKSQKSIDPEIEFIESDGNSISEVECYIHGPADTPYYGGKFKVKLVLQNDYPASPPRGFFLTKIFHPNVSNNGDICVNTLKRDWKPEVTLAHIFQVIRCLLIIPFPESSLNDEAGKLFMESFDEFAKRAKIMTKVHAIPVSRDETSTLGESSSSDKCGKVAQDADASENDANINNAAPSDRSTQQGLSHPTTVFNVVDANINSKVTPSDVSGDQTTVKAKKIVSSNATAKDAKKKILKRL